MKSDYDSTLRKAEQLLRDGRPEKAVPEYVRYLDGRPNDWAAMNALGDLHARLGQTGDAVARFVQAAAVLDRSGFREKAAAIYRKILKLEPENESARLGLALASRPRPAGPNLRPAAPPTDPVAPDQPPAWTPSAPTPPVAVKAAADPAATTAAVPPATRKPAPASDRKTSQDDVSGPGSPGARPLEPQTLEEVFEHLRETFALRARPEDRDWAVSWFRHAAEALSDTGDPYASLLYDLGDGLEMLNDRALARTVFERLARHAPSYRDVAARVERLSKDVADA